MARNLNTFAFSERVSLKLFKRGFTTTDDLSNIGATSLSAESGLSIEECVEVLETVFTNLKEMSSGVTALELLTLEKSKIPIPTFCQDLDSILGGGISVGKVTEICGNPGSGKTQMCLQLCVNAQIPSSCGGIGGEAVLIDTEGSLCLERLNQVADHTAILCNKIFKYKNPGTNLESLTSEKLLQGIYCFHCTNYVELIAVVNVLEDFLQHHPKVSLVLIDSISFQFKYGFEESFSIRTRILNGLSQSFIRIANQFKLAFVVTNQMTTRFREDEIPHAIPALGECWGHNATVRILLVSENNVRKAILFKSPSKKEASAKFQITVSGIRDYVNSITSTEESSSLSEQPCKKVKLC